MDIRALSESIVNETKKIIVGKDEQIRLIVMAILADGHVLIDDLPGVGKTTLVKTISRALGCESGRIQFVPDLLPSDIIGMRIFNQKTGDFELRQGPVMTNLLLADEINRAIPRTQSALLEAMEERQISIDGSIFPLPRPFLVLATQNPVESESTFRLPAAQLDRFLVRVRMGYPTVEQEMEMLKVVGDEIPFESVSAVTSAEELIGARESIRSVFVSDAVSKYIVSVCDATRHDPRLRLGASPRAARALYRASKAWAAMDGRDFVTPEDVKTLAASVLTHRLVLSTRMRVSEGGEQTVLEDILSSVSAAPTREQIANED